DRMKSKIEQHRLDLNYRSPEAVLADPTKQWQPTTPLNQQPAAAVEVAHNLRRALSFYITNRNDVSLRPGELKQRLLSDYQAAFGKRIVPRHAVRLAEMVLLRDRGREEFDRIELYLPVSEIRNKNGETPSADFPALVDALGIVRDISALSVADRACLWKAAIDDFLALLDCGVSRVNSKRQIVSFLLGRVPGLSATRHALRVAFDAKLSAFQSQGVSGICDKRREKSGRSRIVPYTSPEALSDDEKLLLCRANSVGGGLSQAFRELHRGIEIIPGQMMQFSESFRATYGFNAREAKSHVPRSLRDKLRPLLKSIEPLNHGPKAARLAAPSIHRDWSNILAGSLFQSDDETANHYVWFQSEDGEYEFQGMRFDVLRPQILPMVDVRTDYVLSVLLLCRRQYNSRDIRSLILKTCLDERIGLPFDGFYFEGNIWQARNVLSLVNWSEIDEAFSRSGLELRLRHATTPKAKIIERIFSQEQNSMQALPGYAGRNERTDGYERVRGSLALMKRFGQPIKQEVAPWDHFLSADQYLDQLQSAYERFNAEPQNGTRLKGMSPAEAWKELAGGRAHHVVPDSLRYLLATEQREVTVSREGVRVRIGGENRYFCESDRLGTLVGEKVLVRWNQDFPDHVVVVHPKTDPMAQNPFIVRHTPLIDAVNASKEDISNARSRQKSFLDPQRSIFRMLNHQHGKTIRDELLGNFNLRLAGEAHEEAQRGEVEAKPSREARVSRARKAATRAGISPEKIKRPDRAAGLELLPDLEARILQREAQGKL
ncbi:MAG: hypothetical protein ACOYM3_17485, partial [Terrimicrobiaceae bacterium]